jgi:hemerythrin
MKPYELTADLMTGIDEIDNQHRKLLGWANAISVDDTEAGVEKVDDTLDNLLEYVSYHFKTEEQAMVTYGYDQLEKHQKQHERLMLEVAELFARAKREGASRGKLVELQYLLTDWIQLHIKEWDKPFAGFLKEMNVSSSVSLTE